jgi:hypothetical protein
LDNASITAGRRFVERRLRVAADGAIALSAWNAEMKTANTGSANRPQNVRWTGLLSLFAVGAVIAPALAGARRVPTFEADIQPLLRARCLSCHDARTRQGRLRLDSVAAMLTGGNSGPAIEAGAPERSLLLEKVAAGEMPPGKVKLTADETALLRGWVQAGLPGQDRSPRPADTLFTTEERSHWAFRPLGRPPLPEPKGAERSLSPIDRFLLARLRARGLTFSGPADRRTLLRRVTFDLTGLPPTVEEQYEFERDDRSDAYERAVDRLLASRQFGVRWGRHWLDVAGYTDTITFDEDFGEPRGFLEGKWRYRDYVIDAFNRDLPYDRFVREQLAGDELVYWRDAKEYSAEVIEKLVATGFLRTPEDLTVDDFRPFVVWSNVHETVEQVGTTFLGLSLLCARCHSHKFEPIPQRDYYSLMALFTPALNPKNWKNARARLLPDVASPLQAEIDAHNRAVDRSIDQVQQQIASLRRPYELKLREEKLKAIPEPVRADLKAALELPAERQDLVQKYLVGKLGPLVKVEPAAIEAALGPGDREKLGGLARQVAELNAKKRSHGWIHAVYDVGAPPATHLFKRGELERPGAEVPPGFLRLLSGPGTEGLLATPPEAPGTSGRRTALARWLTAADSPASGLAARVMVNRVWQYLFGQGLAATTENVGMSGTPPTHPELLDWLAADFRESGWKIKRVIRALVLSVAYRQASATGTAHKGRRFPAQIDPQNRLLWHMPLRRLDAESMRDAIAMQSGRLDLALGGPPVPLVYDLKSGRVSETEPAAGVSYRRSVYLTNRRVYNPTLLSTFDKPNVSRGVCRRDLSATPQQSLALMNDGFLIANAERCADRIRMRGPATVEAKIGEAYRLILGRLPDPEELGWCGELLAQQSAAYRTAGQPNEEAARRAFAGLCQTLWATSDFLYLR